MIRAIVLAWLLLLLGAAPVAAAERDVYFVAIGSSNYVDPGDETLRGFGRILGANKSARAVGDLLTQRGARAGVVLTAPKDGYVSASDMRGALGEIGKTLAKDKPKSPFLIVYIASHGVSEGFAWSHFSIPGDVVFRHAEEGLTMDQMMRGGVSAAELVDALDKFKVPYLLLLDSCYEGKAAVLENPVLSPAASQSLAGIGAVLRQINMFEQASPVVYSTTPGQVVSTVPDPRQENADAVAPIARRLLIVFARPDHPRTLGALLKAVVDPGLDTLTGPPVTHAKAAGFWNDTLFKAPDATARVDARQGTADKPSVCCGG